MIPAEEEVVESSLSPPSTQALIQGSQRLLLLQLEVVAVWWELYQAIAAVFREHFLGVSSMAPSSLGFHDRVEHCHRTGPVGWLCWCLSWFHECYQEERVQSLLLCGGVYLQLGQGRTEMKMSSPHGMVRIHCFLFEVMLLGSNHHVDFDFVVARKIELLVLLGVDVGGGLNGETVDAWDAAGCDGNWYDCDGGGNMLMQFQSMGDHFGQN